MNLTIHSNSGQITVPTGLVEMTPDGVTVRHRYDTTHIIATLPNCRNAKITGDVTIDQEARGLTEELHRFRGGSLRFDYSTRNALSRLKKILSKYNSVTGRWSD